MREKLTKKDVEKIEQEIEHRKLVVRKEAIEAVKEARAQGDLSENFEYYAAKRHKNQNESRIRYLLLMPGGDGAVKAVTKAVQDGVITVTDVRRCAANVLHGIMSSRIYYAFCKKNGTLLR